MRSVVVMQELLRGAIAEGLVGADRVVDAFPLQRLVRCETYWTSRRPRRRAADVKRYAWSMREVWVGMACPTMTEPFPDMPRARLTLWSGSLGKTGCRCPASRSTASG